MSKKNFVCFTLVFLLFLLFHPTLQAKAEQDNPTVSANTELEDLTVSANAGDSWEKLQTLLDYNKDGKYNLTIQIPAGSYELKNELIIYSNTTILADPNARLNKNHQKGAILANDLTKDKGGYDSASNITIIGGIWDSSKIAYKNKGTESFRFIHASNITIKDATICNVPENSHLITFAGVRNGVVDHCTLYGYVGNISKEAIQLDIVHDSVRVPSMQASYVRYDDLPCDGIKITNCEIYDFPRAIGSHTSIKGVFHKNIEITGNNLHDLQEAAIKIYNYQNTVISDNTIHNAAVGVLVYTYLGNGQNHYLEALKRTQKEPLPAEYNIVIRNNKIDHMLEVKTDSGTSWGIGIRTIGCKTRPLTGITLENNTISDTDRYGMLLQRTPDSRINKNSVESTNGSGIYLIDGSDYSEITDNTLTQNGSAADSLSGGIGLSATTDTLISGNTVSSPAKDGIFLDNKSNSCTVTGNTVTAARNNAIALYNQSNENSVEDNTVEDFINSGIYTFKINSAIINNNKIYGKSGISEDGININGNNTSKSNFTLDGNYIKTARRYGIYLNSAPKSYVGGNTILEIKKNAIYLDKGSDGSKVYYNIITYTDNSITRYDRIKTADCKQVLRYDNIIYQV